MTRRHWWILGVGIAVWALFLTQGLTLWDDDFTSWIKRYVDRPSWRLLIDVISPFSTQSESWGFNERPIQALLYRLAALFSGDRAWAFFLLKSLTLVAMGLGVAAWVLHLTREQTRSPVPALLSAIWVSVSGATGAALVWHPDYAPLAEAWFLAGGLLLWSLTEHARSGGTISARQWIAAAAFVAVGYKSKADLKLLPAIWATYVLMLPELRQQWRRWILPASILVIYAIPWGPQIFVRLPPFVPGSGGSSVGWMWQPASMDRLKDFFWLRENWDLSERFLAPTLALGWNLGFLLPAGMVFLVWRTGGVLDRVPWLRLTHPSDRARLWVLIWLVWMTVAVTALPAINYTFRVRYGILLWVPVTLLLGSALGFVVEAWRTRRMPVWLKAVLVSAFALQLGLNGWKAMRARRDLGAVMVAVDRAYRAVDERYPLERLVWMPDFRPYDSRPASSRAVREAVWLKANEDIRGQTQAGRVTVALSWSASFWEEIDFEERFTGCPGGVLFDFVFPCRLGDGAFLYRYIGRDADYQRGEEARKRGAQAEALAAYRVFLARYPKNFAGHFVQGLTALAVGDHVLAESSWRFLEHYFPRHLSVLYNLALTLQSQGKAQEARERLLEVIAMDDRSYGAWFHLCSGWIQEKNWRRARKALDQMEKRFPGDKELGRMRSALPA